MDVDKVEKVQMRATRNAKQLKNHSQMDMIQVFIISGVSPRNRCRLLVRFQTVKTVKISAPNC